MVSETEINDSLRHRGIPPQRDIGYGGEVAGTLRHFQPCKKYGIEKGGTHLAYAAAGARFQFAVNNDRRLFIPIGCRAGTGGAVVGKSAPGFR